MNSPIYDTYEPGIYKSIGKTPIAVKDMPYPHLKFAANKCWRNSQRETNPRWKHFLVKQHDDLIAEIERRDKENNSEFIKGYNAAVQNGIHCYPMHKDIFARIIAESGFSIKDFIHAQKQSEFMDEEMNELYELSQQN